MFQTRKQSCVTINAVYIIVLQQWWNKEGTMVPFEGGPASRGLA